MPLTWIEINKNNLCHNLTQFKKIAPDSQIWPVVKSNAYGHGLEEIVAILDKDKLATGFMVVNLTEAIKVRQLTKKSIMVLSYFDRDKKVLKKISQENISLPIYDLATADYLNKLRYKFSVNIKIDTGTSRLGFSAQEAIEAIGYIKDKKYLEINSLFTHYAESEADGQSFTKEQLAILETIAQTYPKIKIHSACSAASINLPESQQDIVRLGISLYGLWPSPVTKNKAMAFNSTLKPVMSIKTKIIQIKKIQKGSFVGYNRTYQCLEDCKIAIIPFGYYEGYNRLLSNKAQVLIKGQRYQVRGNICMNLSMIELIQQSDVKVGDIVTLLGQDKNKIISAEDLAKQCQTINYEIITKINSNLKRIIV